MIIAGIVGWWIWAVSEIYARHDEQRRYHAAHESRGVQEEIYKACANTDLVATMKCIDDKRQAGRQEERNELDLHAQEEMAFWALCMFVATIGSLLATLAGIYFVNRTLRTTIESLAITKTALDHTVETDQRQLRAYMVCSGGEVAGLSSGFPTARFHLNNSGQTPAFGVHCAVFVVVTVGEQRRTRTLTIASDATIGGGDALTVSETLPKDLFAPPEGGGPSSPIAMRLWLSVTYIDVFDREQTEPFAMRLSERGRVNDVGILVIDADKMGRVRERQRARAVAAAEKDGQSEG